MSIKVELLKWAEKTFGTLDPSDVFSIREDVKDAENPKIVHQKIELHIKKRIGKDEGWIERSQLEDWEAHLKKIVGPHLAFDMKGNEGREKHRVCGVVEGNYKELRMVHLYNYQFNLIVIKARKITEKSHVGIKPKNT